MKKVVLLAVALWVVWGGAAVAGEPDALERLHGGNILQSLHNAAQKREVKASFDTAKVNVINDIAVITGNATDSIMFIVTLYKETAKVRTLVLLVKQWDKQNAADAVFSIMAINNFMGRLIRPDITDESLKQMYLALVGGKMEALDGKTRKVRLDGVLLTSGFEKGAGFAISAVAADKQ